MDKKGYNYRITCLNSLAVMMKYLREDVIASEIIPVFIKALNDDIPNVRFSCSKLILENKQFISSSTFQS